MARDLGFWNESGLELRVEDLGSKEVLKFYGSMVYGLSHRRPCDRCLVRNKRVYTGYRDDYKGFNRDYF